MCVSAARPDTWSLPACRPYRSPVLGAARHGTWSASHARDRSLSDCHPQGGSGGCSGESPGRPSRGRSHCVASCCPAGSDSYRGRSRRGRTASFEVVEFPSPEYPDGVFGAAPASQPAGRGPSRPGARALRGGRGAACRQSLEYRYRRHLCGAEQAYVASRQRAAYSPVDVRRRGGSDGVASGQAAASA